jgi:hypothetical protein
MTLTKSLTASEPCGVVPEISASCWPYFASASYPILYTEYRLTEFAVTTWTACNSELGHLVNEIGDEDTGTADNGGRM